jgi:hypothetical protein
LIKKSKNYFKKIARKNKLKKKEIPTSFATFENKSRPIRERQLERPIKVPEPTQGHNKK